MEANARHRTHSTDFKVRWCRSIFPARHLHGLAKRYDVSRNLIRIWIQKHDAGAFDDDAVAADAIDAYEARIAALERLVGKQALEIEFFKGLSKSRTPAKSATTSVCHRPMASPSQQGCRLMGIARSTFYDAGLRIASTTLRLLRTWRDRPTASRHMVSTDASCVCANAASVVNHKKLRRLMRPHDLQAPSTPTVMSPRPTASHELPIFPNLARNMTPCGPDQLWVADITYVASRAGSSISP